MFLMLSTITALLECGPVFLGICLGYSPGQLLSLCLAYQFGNLFPVPFRLPRNALMGITFLAAILLVLAGFSTELPLLQWILYLAGLMLLSCTTQSIRAKIKGQAGTVKKRLCRVAGFFLAPLMSYIPHLILLICCLIVLSALRHTPEKAFRSDTVSISCNIVLKNSCYKIMLWHQLHYFIYAYAMILLVYDRTNKPFGTMLLFAGTWLTYLMTEPLLTRIHPNLLGRLSSRSLYTAIILGGHSFLLFLLLLIPNVSTISLIILWILTGFGGGTVFAITALCKQSAAYEKKHLELTENIGHFAGTAFAALFGALFPQNLSSLSYVSALCVIVVLALTLKQKAIRQ